MGLYAKCDDIPKTSKTAQGVKGISLNDDEVKVLYLYAKSSGFPKKGIMFRDITSALQDKEGLKLTIESMERIIKDMEPTVIAGAEARGFLLGMPVAYNLSLPFVPVRKKGKLPCDTVSQSYDLEYGSAEIEIDISSIKKGDRVVLVDDLIATGGTMKAAIALIERLGGEVAGIAALIELVDLKGREILSPYRVESVIQYEGD